QNLHLVDYHTGLELHPFVYYIDHSRNSKFDYYPEDGIFPPSYMEQTDSDTSNQPSDIAEQPYLSAPESTDEISINKVTFTTAAGIDVTAQQVDFWLATSTHE